MNDPAEVTARAKRGAANIISDCLCLRRGDILAVFYDESCEDVAELVVEAAESQDLEVHRVFAPLERQRRFARANEPRLSEEEHRAINASRGILTCLSGHAAGTAYRKQLVTVGTDRTRRLGHMPGANLRILGECADVDYDLQEARCDDLCLALSLAERAELETYACDAAGHVESTLRLRFELGGLFRPAIPSAGRVERGTWGNVPGGESFIAPLEGTAEGEFALNGSMDGWVFDPGDHLTLAFEDGALSDVSGNPRAAEHFDAFFEIPRERGETNCSRLAELGIGVNEKIESLTGKSLIDEKCAGTAHIAVGDNTRYGGDQPSSIHEDLVTRRPSLRLDGKAILDHGKFVLETAEWRDSLAGDRAPIPPEAMVSRTGVGSEICPDGSLRVRRTLRAGRYSIYTVGDQATSPVVARVFQKLPNIPSQIRLDHLLREARQELGLGPEVLMASLSILHRHRLVDY